jgi:hypothetical protein
MACVTTVPASGLHPETVGYECQSCEHGVSAIEIPAKLNALLSALLRRSRATRPPKAAR